MTAQQMNPNHNRRPSTNLGDELLSLQEACTLLRVPEGTLRRWSAGKSMTWESLRPELDWGGSEGFGGEEGLGLGDVGDEREDQTWRLLTTGCATWRTTPMASGSVTRRAQSWRARYTHPETGKRHQRTFKRQVDAQRWLRGQLEALDKGAWVNPQDGRVTFSSYGVVAAPGVDRRHPEGDVARGARRVVQGSRAAKDPADACRGMG